MPVQSGLENPSQDNTPLGNSFSLTDLSVGTVEVIDPAHPLYGRTFPLISITNKQRVGPACVIWTEPGDERVIPLAVTNLAPQSPAPRSACRLSLSSAENLLAVLASIPDVCPPQTEEAHANTEIGASAQSSTADPLSGDVSGDSDGASTGHRSEEPHRGRWSVSEVRAEQGLENAGGTAEGADQQQLDEGDAGGSQ